MSRRHKSNRARWKVSEKYTDRHYCTVCAGTFGLMLYGYVQKVKSRTFAVHHGVKCQSRCLQIQILSTPGNHAELFCRMDDYFSAGEGT